MIPIDFDDIDTADDGTATFFHNGKLFSGIAYQRDSDTGVIVELMGFDRGWLNGCSRMWSLSGILLEEAFLCRGLAQPRNASRRE